MFLGHGEIVSQRGREKSDIERYYAELMVPGDLAKGLPVIVLVDSGTASASEIVAGALQDHHRGLVMGERSFGKGSVQTILPMGQRAALRLTTARYFTPSGHSVQEGGIKPDLLVPQISDPDYKDRTVIREADLRKHLINAEKVDDATLEEDAQHRSALRRRPPSSSRSRASRTSSSIMRCRRSPARAASPQVAAKGR